MSLKQAEFEELGLSNVFLIKNQVFNDERGRFIKVFNSDNFIKNDIDCDFKESYYSISHKNVIRGIHFQLPPFEHNKLVYVSKGKILDVILDLRRGSPTYGKYETVYLDENLNSIYIPKGCAHGFGVLSDFAVVHYQVSSVYNPNSDCGILWNSFGFDWPIESPIISKRDLSFNRFLDFDSPFL